LPEVPTTAAGLVRGEGRGICTAPGHVERQDEPFTSQPDNRSQTIALPSACDRKLKDTRARQGEGGLAADVLQT
jgi:hypothetical protein